MPTARAQLHSKREQIEKLKRQIAELEDHEAKRLGRIAQRAGLADLEVAEETLHAAFQALADRLRSGEPETQPLAPLTPALEAPPATLSAGATHGTQTGHAA